jgi:tRNA-intron endonuclease
MSKTESALESTELRIKGSLVKKGVRVSKRSDVDALSQRGYGVADGKKLLLGFCEALYLVDKGMLEVKTKKDGKIDFQKLLRYYGDVDENAWAKYLCYRDLRSRGYVVREGFGLGVIFRVYERGDYSKDTAKYLILNVQEGKPLALEDLAIALKQCQSSKKELVLAVMNRRGEFVYYSVSQMTLPIEATDDD